MSKVIGVLVVLASSANAFSGTVLLAGLSKTTAGASRCSSLRAESTAEEAAQHNFAAQRTLETLARPAQTCRNFNRASFRDFAKSKELEPELRAPSVFLQQLTKVPLCLIDGDGGSALWSVYGIVAKDS
eukprot:CAMPEP_0179435022 /NCGR_PEP_ID=MMETSP0799-20121207/19217_1 /TAXON_ID=46947 /ORGANISM="Geminigera cryophila, Strain CCMP2564" /LENGTH=128 /DNA_ID=CAMNT_0021214147 /DNA_START=150 /DNA_END=536 /DNA_ORIENTATION=-